MKSILYTPGQGRPRYVHMHLPGQSSCIQKHFAHASTTARLFPKLHTICWRSASAVSPVGTAPASPVHTNGSAVNQKPSRWRGADLGNLLGYRIPYAWGLVAWLTSTATIVCNTNHGHAGFFSFWSDDRGVCYWVLLSSELNRKDNPPKSFSLGIKSTSSAVLIREVNRTAGVVVVADHPSLTRTHSVRRCHSWAHAGSYHGRAGVLFPCRVGRRRTTVAWF